jgi:flavodoxin I
MKALIVYDSVHGNTEAIAKAIGDAIPGEVEVVRAGEVGSPDLGELDLLIVGAPTYGGRPTPPVRDFLGSVLAGALEGASVAAFDTRIPARWVRIFGYAAGKIARRLEGLGGTLVVSPEGFFVKGTEGPLLEGEVERAAGWAKEVVEASES